MSTEKKPPANTTKKKGKPTKTQAKAPSSSQKAPSAPVLTPPHDHSPPPPGNKGGRPTVYSEAVATAICNAIAIDNLTLREICSQPSMPALSTVMLWAMDSNHPFSEQYARARAAQAELRVDELDSLARSAIGLVKLTPAGECVDPGAVAAIKLLIDTRKWAASKALPKVYGDKLDIKTDAKFVSLTDLAAQIAKEPDDE